MSDQYQERPLSGLGAPLKWPVASHVAVALRAGNTETQSSHPSVLVKRLTAVLARDTTNQSRAESLRSA